MATRGSYVHISMRRIIGQHPPPPLPPLLVLRRVYSDAKLIGFEQKDSQGFENSYNSYEQYPLEKIFIFIHLNRNYTLEL